MSKIEPASATRCEATSLTGSAFARRSKRSQGSRLIRCKHAEMDKECRAVRAAGKVSAIPPKTEASVSESHIAGTEPCEGLLVEHGENGVEVWRDEQAVDEDLCVIEGVADALQAREVLFCLPDALPFI